MTPAGERPHGTPGTGRPTLPAEHARTRSAGAQTWTTRKLLRWMIAHFESRHIDSPRLVAEMLLSHVFQCERMRLYMEVDRPASPPELAALRSLVTRAARHEPVQYLTGEAWFFSRAFEVDRSTLIPRPSTETLVEHILQWRRAEPERAAPLIADIGTGTGCIAITLALQIPDAHVVATDIVPAALDLARRNAERHRVADRVELRQGTGLDPLRQGPPGERFDAICSNPPYVSDDEWEELEPNVREYEPSTALRGGPDGLDVIRPLIQSAPELLAPGGQLAIEIGHFKKDAILDLAQHHPLLTDAAVLKDHEGYWRVLTARRADS